MNNIWRFNVKVYTNHIVKTGQKWRFLYDKLSPLKLYAIRCEIWSSLIYNNIIYRFVSNSLPIFKKISWPLLSKWLRQKCSLIHNWHLFYFQTFSVSLKNRDFVFFFEDLLSIFVVVILTKVDKISFLKLAES